MHIMPERLLCRSLSLKFAFRSSVSPLSFPHMSSLPSRVAGRPRALLVALDASTCLGNVGRHDSQMQYLNCSNFPGSSLPLHSACLSSASLSFWLCVGEGGVAVTRLFLDSLNFAGVPCLVIPLSLTFSTSTLFPRHRSSFEAH
jgi:hypothetical protein